MDDTQATLCERLGAVFQPSLAHLRLGVALTTLDSDPSMGSAILRKETPPVAIYGEAGAFAH
jgi:hypothetical protein